MGIPRRFGDLAVAGDIDFPDLPAAIQPADILIRRGPVARDTGVLIQQWLGDDGDVLLSITRIEEGYRVSLAGLHCAISRDGRAVTVDAASNLGDGALEHLVLHQVLPLAVSRGGRFVLHACAVETPRGAIAFIGESGAGKSTLAAAFCSRGFPLVADDALVMDMSGPSPAAWPTADGVRLWADMRGAAPPGIALTPAGAGKLHALVPLARGRAEVIRFYLLDTSEDESTSIRPEAPAAVRMAMLSHVFRLDVTDRDESARLFECANRGALEIPARRVFYPNGLEFLHAAVDAVLRDLA